MKNRSGVPSVPCQVTNRNLLCLILLVAQDLMIPTESIVPASLRNGEVLGDTGGTDLKP